jgi:hypothetical protein
MKNSWLFVCALLMCTASPAVASGKDGRPFTIEYYYKVKWGHFDEWLQLYKKNHWPVIASEMKDGFIVGYKIEQPRGYWPEPYKWDVRISITWRDALVAHGLVDKKRKATLARLFPDRVKHEQEEQRRFQILKGLWEAEPEAIDTEGWPVTGGK